MKDLEEILANKPSIDSRPLHCEQVAVAAREELERGLSRKQKINTLIFGGIGGIAAVLILQLFMAFSNKRGEPSPIELELNGAMVIRAYQELSETFSGDLAAVAVVDGEIQVFPNMENWNSFQHVYLEMKVGEKMVRIVATHGAMLPVEVDGNVHLIEILSDSTGSPNVLGENFFWSADDHFMPEGQEILTIEHVEVVL